MGRPRLAPRLRSRVLPLAAGAASLALATAVAALLESGLGVPDASPVYLLAVVAMASLYGTWPAIATSVLSLLTYDFLFTAPRFTFAVADPQEWLSLLLFLFVAAVTGRLAALQRERAEEALRRVHEAQTLFAISRSLATGAAIREATFEIVDRLRADAGVERVWVGIGPSPAWERPLADSAPQVPRPETASRWILRRQPGERPAEWVRVHTGRQGGGRGHPPSPDVDLFQVAIAADGQDLGSIWVLRARSAGPPGRGATRILSLAADQLGLAIHREDLAREATAAEIARASDALKSALLDSVSHDLRTPLASIRAAAGNLMDPGVDLAPEERHALAVSIDAEAERLSSFVRDLLDLSRIQAGALVPHVEVYELRELVEPVAQRLEPTLGGRRVAVEIADDLPPVLVDAVLFDQVVSNLLENAGRYAPPPAPIRIVARPAPDASVELVVEDGGPGVPAEALGHVFERFYRVGRAGEGSRRGLGIGLALVRGFVEAMGGRAEATPSELGGLAVRLTLRAASVPATEAVR
jgi:two-component system sensor histidine kinase KdpD